jgi:aralkylamine N-acetyltransferase
MRPMEITLRFDADGVRAAELEALFAAAALGGRRGDKIRRAFLKSTLVCLAYEGDRLVGASRALSDGEYHTLIYDVAVLPEHQHAGVGRRMMEALMERLPAWRTMLIAGSGVQPFYRRFGFEIYPDVMARLDRDRLYDAGDEPAEAAPGS